MGGYTVETAFKRPALGGARFAELAEAEERAMRSVLVAAAGGSQRQTVLYVVEDREGGRRTVSEVSARGVRRRAPVAPSA